MGLLLRILTGFFIISCCLWSTCLTFPSRNDLHRLMDSEELTFYFGRDHSLPEYEIVDLPENLYSGRESVVTEDGESTVEKVVSFDVFDKSINLVLYPNRGLLSPFAKIVKKSKNKEQILSEKEKPNFCHYLHLNDDMTAAISNCIPKEVNGLIFMNDITLEILPLTTRLKLLLTLRGWSLADDGSKSGIGVAKVPHLIKKAVLEIGNFDNDYLWESVIKKKSLQEYNELYSNFTHEDPDVQEGRSNENRALRYDQPVVELALFFDEPFYNIFGSFFENDSMKLKNMVLSYVNGVQALYHHSSLGRKIEFTIVYLEIMETQSEDMPHAYGERNALLDSFCAYQKKLNPGDDRDPKHWDMSVYISGLDFFAWDSNGIKSGVTMGLATVGGVCLPDYNCVIAEFGTVNSFGKPYPSAGFTSVYILAHEIGHNLGMSHDATGNSCSKDGFVMSPSRGTQGETTWSSCSANIVRRLDWAKCLFDQPVQASTDIDVWKYNDYPGVSYTAKAQCEILLRDRNAVIFINGPSSSVCQNLHCRTPNKSGFFFAGPALQGTDCGEGKWCEGGDCISKNKIEQKPNLKPKPNWGPWKGALCRSGCINKGKGYVLKKRVCNKPDPTDDQECEGHSNSVNLCEDAKVCKLKRKSIIEYTTEKCQEFQLKLPHLAADGLGLQAPHEDRRLWMACSIFCKLQETGAYYTPRLELNNLGLNPYLPDGTWCHTSESENYYCLQHHCLPESTKFSTTKAITDNIPENLLIFTTPINDDVLRYFSVDSNGKPQSTKLLSNKVEVSKNLDKLWADEDNFVIINENV